MKKYLYIIFAWALTMSLTSCEDDDQYSIESVIIGRAWTGDVGMNAENGEPIFSTFYKPQNKLNTQNKTFCFRFT